MGKKRRGTKHTVASGKRRSSSRNRISRADSQILHHLDQLLERRRRTEQLAARVPPELITEQFEYSDGTTLFRFSHTQLGDLGLLKIVPVPAYMAPIGGCLLNVGLFPNDPDTDEQWNEKYRLLKMMVELCASALPEQKILHAPLPEVTIAREQRRFFLRFAACRHPDELRVFAQTLTHEQYQMLLAGIQQASLAMSGQEQTDLLARGDEFYQIWRNLQHPDIYS